MMAKRICSYCEGDEFFWADELECAGSPNATGWEILICAKCGCVVPDDYTKDTKRYVGC